MAPPDVRDQTAELPVGGPRERSLVTASDSVSGDIFDNRLPL